MFIGARAFLPEKRRTKLFSEAAFMIRFVFLDLDDTIFDFHKAERIAIAATLEEAGIEPKPETLTRYSEINAEMWRRLERGELTREEVLKERFRALFRELGISADAARTKKTYEEKLSVGHYFMPNAHEILEKLYGKYRLFIMSNGTAHVQDSRIGSSDIPRFFEKIFISEKVGYNKPASEFFDACFAEIEEFSRNEAIIVGDSLSSDIAGGINAGIKTCLFNPHGKENKTDIFPDFEIKELTELPCLLLGL